MANGAVGGVVEPMMLRSHARNPGRQSPSRNRTPLAQPSQSESQRTRLQEVQEERSLELRRLQVQKLEAEIDLAAIALDLETTRLEASIHRHRVS